MGAPVTLPATLPHWILELLAIGIGAALVVFGQHYGAAADFGGGALGGAGVSGLIHDLTA